MQEWRPQALAVVRDHDYVVPRPRRLPSLMSPSPPSHSSARTLRTLNAVAARHAGAHAQSTAHHKPINVHLQIASGCNLECYMCIELLRPPETRRGRGLQSLEREIFDKLCSQVFPYSSRLHLGFGGEPTLAPDFLYFIERGAASGQVIDLTTNGTRLARPGMAEAIARHVSVLRISIDAATRETYERIRVGSKWSHLLAGLNLLNDARFKLPEKERGELVLVFVLMKSNLHELPQFVELAKEVGADGVRGQHVIPTTEPGKGETLFDEPERYNRIREAAATRARELGIDFDAPAPYAALPQGTASSVEDECSDVASECRPISNQPEKNPRDCRLPTQDLFVTYEGKITPCCNPHANAKMLVGDLAVQDFSQIWNNEAYVGLRESLRTGDLHPICVSCPIGKSGQPCAPEDPEWLLSTPTLQEWAEARETVASSSTADETNMLEGLRASGLAEHMTEIMQDRDALRVHATALEKLQPGQLQHIANLEAERPQLHAHIQELEAALEHARNEQSTHGSESLARRGLRKLSRLLRGRDNT